MGSLLSFPNVLWLGLGLVIFLVVIHLVAMKMLANHFRKKYPEAFGTDGKLKKAEDTAAVLGTAAAVKMAAEENKAEQSEQDQK